MTEDEVKKAVKFSIERLKAEIPQLEFWSVHERSTAHRLAVHLEGSFKGWNVDCEYDRDEQTKKKLIGIKECKPGKATDEILPDIIVHHRGEQGQIHNLLVIELKKDSKEDKCDKLKLKLLTKLDGDYKYKFGLYINIDGGNFACTWYQDGKQLS